MVLQENIDVVNIHEIVRSGWKNLKLKKIQEAVNDFQEACNHLTKTYGETSFESAEALFGYGCALLELSRMENGVLGNALEGIAVGEATEIEQDASVLENEAGESFLVEDGTTAEQKEIISEEIIDAMVGESAEAAGEPQDIIKGEKKDDLKEEKENDGVDENVKEAVDENVEDAVDENVEASSNAAEAGDVETEDGDDAEADNDCEEASGEEVANEENVENGTLEESVEVGNLQLSWEVMDLSKTIYEKECARLAELENEDAKRLEELILKQADCLLKLGEIGVESDNYDVAIGDYLSCKELLEKAHLPADDRRHAEVLYQLGLAYGYKCSYELAKKLHNEALEVILLRVKNIKSKIDELKQDEDKEEIEALQSELENLNSLIPEIKTKIEEFSEELSRLVDVKEEVEENGFKEKAENNEQPTQDISHMLRKKRKSEIDDNDDQASKKAKLEEMINEVKPESINAVESVVMETDSLTAPDN